MNDVITVGSYACPPPPALVDEPLWRVEPGTLPFEFWQALELDKH